MSIKVDRDKCRSCGKCIEVCPGNLLRTDETGKTLIKYPKDCWGCAACLKECRFGALKFFLAPDIGGRGTYLYTTRNKEFLLWHFVQTSGREQVIKINTREANQY